MKKLPTPKTPVNEDWPSHYIVYRLRERGQSLRRLARRHDYCQTGGAVVMFRPWPNMERVIANAIGVKPQEIWPSRYKSDGTPQYGYYARAKQRTQQHSTARDGVNVHSKRAA
jgi:Ner family transcriptional regulator